MLRSLFDERLHPAPFSTGLVSRRRCQVRHQFNSVLGRLGHLVVQYIGGKGRVSQQLRALGTELRKPRHNRLRIILSIPVATLDGIVE